MLQYLKTINNDIIPKILIVAEMSSIGNIIDVSYTTKCYEIAVQYPELVLGFICQKKFIKNDNFIFITPGINLDINKKNDQQYKTPKQAYENGSDIIIVGSGIYSNTNTNPLNVILNYKCLSHYNTLKK